MKKTWIIFGASSAISRAFADEIAPMVDKIILIGRDQQDLQAIASDLALRHQVATAVLTYDLANMQQHQELLSACQAQAEGELNAFFAFAMMPPQDKCFADIALTHQVIHTNYVAHVSLLQTFIPALQQQTETHLCVIGSIAGDRGRKKNFIYASTKNALAIYCEGLQGKLLGSSIHLTFIKPGYIDTRMTFGSVKSCLTASPQRFAKACVKAIKRKRRLIYFPWFWRVISLVVRLIPLPLLIRTSI